MAVCKDGHFYFEPSYRISIKLLLRRTLLLQQFYAAKFTKAIIFRIRNKGMINDKQQTTNTGDLLYQIALTLVPNIGAVQAKILVDHFGDAESIFKASI